MIKIGKKIWYLKYSKLNHDPVIARVIDGKCDAYPHLWYTDDRMGRYYVVGPGGPIPEKNAFRTKIGLVLSLLLRG